MWVQFLVEELRVHIWLGGNGKKKKKVLSFAAGSSEWKTKVAEQILGKEIEKASEIRVSHEYPPRKGRNRLQETDAGHYTALFGGREKLVLFLKEREGEKLTPELPKPSK